MKNYILFFLLTLFTSCHCVETHLTKEERAWFSVYEKGQSIIFRSNRGNLDTLVVTEKTETHNNKDCNWVEIGFNQPNIMFLILKSKTCHNDPYCEGELFISKEKKEEKCEPSFSFFGLVQKREHEYLIPKLEKIKLNTTNVVYSQVYCFEDGVNANGWGLNSPKSFCWDKKNGLIKYVSHDGETFELLKKIN